ncbi:hypothetical protein [Sphingobacterium sp.]|uniref:hypothetical protein n=1 Tax=Sphingobacterium sp. TaxID=341027 RepID=UPI0028AA2750|nr:hypothetical protein [Sphingobacterium sp.]
MKPLKRLEFELEKSACVMSLIADRAGQKKNSSNHKVIGAVFSYKILLVTFSLTAWKKAKRKKRQLRSG